MRVEDTTARTDDETGTLTVPSKILPPRSAPGKNHDNPSLIQSHRPAGHLQHPSTARQQAQKRVFMEKEYDNHLLTLMLHQLRVAPAVQLGCDCVEDPARHRLILCYCLLN